VSLSRDTNTPVVPTLKDQWQFETHQDIKGLRRELEKARGDPIAIRKVQSRLRSLLSTLSTLVVQKRREDYFRRVDDIRALSQSTAGEGAAARDGSEDKKGTPQSKSAMAIGLFLQMCKAPKDRHSELFMNLLVKYLKQLYPIEIMEATSIGGGTSDSADAGQPPAPERGTVVELDRTDTDFTQRSSFNEALYEGP
jgi:hypothetical protein